jgi:site-specific recombinase
MTSTRAAHRSLLAALRKRELVVIESPYASHNVPDLNRNYNYARACIADSLARGEAPFASHLFYTQFLDDKHEASRRTGLMCGWAWLSRATLVAVYLDLGWSSGMREGVSLARSMKIRIEERSVPGWVAPQTVAEANAILAAATADEDPVIQAHVRAHANLPPLYQAPHDEEPSR